MARVDDQLRHWTSHTFGRPAHIYGTIAIGSNHWHTIGAVEPLEFDLSMRYPNSPHLTV